MYVSCTVLCGNIPKLAAVSVLGREVIIKTLISFLLPLKFSLYIFRNKTQNLYLVSTFYTGR